MTVERDCTALCKREHVLSIGAKGARPRVILFLAYSFSCDSFECKVGKNSQFTIKTPPTEDVKSVEKVAQILQLMGERTHTRDWNGGGLCVHVWWVQYTHCTCRHTLIQHIPVTKLLLLLTFSVQCYSRPVIDPATILNDNVQLEISAILWGLQKVSVICYM